MTKMNELANALENGNKICMMRMNQISIFPIHPKKEFGIVLFLSSLGFYII